MRAGWALLGFGTGAAGALAANFAYLYWPESRAEQWGAVAATATAVAALAAVAGLLALAFVYGQSRDSLRRFRVELGPYLRVDFAPDAGGGTWKPPAREKLSNDLTSADVGGGPTDLGGLLAWSGDVEICLWLQNMQPHTAGIAHEVRVDVELSFPDASDDTLDRVLEFQLRIAYLEPGQHIRYLVASVDGSIPRLSGRVTGISYQDLYERELRFAHGSAEFRLAGGKIANDRHVFREEDE
jgi:hypothetical protein